MTSFVESYNKFTQIHQLVKRSSQILFINEIQSFFQEIQKDDKNIRISDQSSIVIEAGTGTGKTISYLISVIKYAPKHNKRIVVSTATTTLQEQLINQDLNLLKQIPEFSEITFKIAKGRNRYLCLYKSESDENKQQIINFTEEELNSEQEQKLILKIYKLYEEGIWNGDKDTLTINISPDTWNKITSSSKTCSYKECPYFKKCVFYKERENLLNQNVIVANHDLVLSDLKLGGGIILTDPYETIYVFDEAHNLPKKAKSHFHKEIHLYKTKESFKKMSQFFEKDNFFQKSNTFKYREEIQRNINDFLETFEQNYKDYKYLISMIENEMFVNASKEKIFRFRFGKINQVLRDHSFKIIVEMKDTIKILYNIQNLLQNEIDLNQNNQILKILNFKVSIYKKDLDDLNKSLKMFADNKEDTFAKWIEFKNQEIIIKIYHLSASEILKNYLFDKSFASILTSATLSVNQNFDRFYQETGLTNHDKSVFIESPFNYQNTIINFHSLANEVNHPEFLNDLIEFLPKILLENNGVFVYFTSKQNMNFVYENLHKLHDRILIQGQTSKQHLLKEHKNKIDKGKSSILFGMDSFAEGLDLPKKYCEQIIITKIPFLNPFNPFMESLSELCQKQNKNFFYEIQIPETAIKLIQICGRLVRTEEDTGQIDILDNRIINKKYGEFLKSALSQYKQKTKF